MVPAEAFHDVDLYRWWAHLALAEGTWPVLDEPWVYPAGALAPVVLPGLATTWSTPGYAVVWCLLVTALDALAVDRLLRRTPHGRRAAAWWLAFLVLLGPVWLGRLDGVVAPLVVVALAEALRRPAVASALLTVGAWVKVAPGAVLLPLAAAARRPLRHVVVPAALVTVVVAGVALGLGAGERVASFLSAQDGRGLQTESVTATPWVLASVWRDDVTIELHPELVTWEVRGPGAATAAGVLDVLLPVAVLAVAGVLVLARLRGRGVDALVPGAVVLLVLLVVVNKVGSPQFLAWIGAGVAVLVAARPPDDGDPGPSGAVRALRGLGAVPGLALLAAALTQAVFPWGYAALLGGVPALAVVLAVRNVVLVVLLVLAARRLRGAVARDDDAPAGRAGLSDPAAGGRPGR